MVFSWIDLNSVESLRLDSKQDKVSEEKRRNLIPSTRCLTPSSNAIILYGFETENFLVSSPGIILLPCSRDVAMGFVSSAKPFNDRDDALRFDVVDDA